MRNQERTVFELPTQCSTIKRLEPIYLPKACCCRGCQQEESAGLKRKLSEAEGSVEGRRALVLGVHHDGEYGDGSPGAQDALNRIGQ
jgi:hypothetical protein